MQLLRIYLLGLGPVILGVVALALPGRNPFRIVGAGLRDLVRRPGGRALLGVAGGVALINFVESPLDPRFTDWLGYDLTGWIARIEGDWIERVQAHVPAFAIAPLAWLYLPGYVGGLLAPLPVWHALGRSTATAGYALGFLANYVLALPFYLFFPVREVAWSGLSRAEPLIERTFPGVSEAMRAGSALDNCFPSLHVSCTVTALWFCQRHGPPGLRAVAWTLALGTAWAVQALGIHWGLDVLTGVLLGVVAARLGESWAARTRYGAGRSNSAVELDAQTVPSSSTTTSRT